MRKPKIKNKYNLTIKDIKHLKIGDRTKFHEPEFWYNNVVNAWCISGDTAKNSADLEYLTYDEFWIGFYDETAKSCAGKFEISFDSYGGMCGYNFNEFYRSQDIENIDDLEIQEKFLEKINWLIDEGVLIR